ncbi:MAG: class I poly(R)-hydroxyalkanoic acid synthase, partial [Gammaproteobacteria bacterium]
MTTPELSQSMETSDLAPALQRISERSQKLIADYATRRELDDGYNVLDPAVVGKTFLEITTRLMSRPDLVMREQLAFWQGYTQLWQRTTERFLLNKPAEPVISPAANDRRFKDNQWAENYLFDFIKQCYLLAAHSIETAVSQVDGLDVHTAKKAKFYTRQVVDALSPSNFVATNPQVLKATLESRGENLVKGLSNLLEDLDRGKG